MAKELEGPKMEIHIDLLWMILKKYQIGKCMAMRETWILVQEIHHHSWQTSTWNEQMSISSTCTQMDNQRKDHTDPKHYDVENTSSTNKGRDLFIANELQIVPWGTERMPQRI